MSKKTIDVPRMEESDYRDPGSFTDFVGDRWNDFLQRWNDQNISTDEAKGLLHTVADRLGWANEAFADPERIGEDSRETCVRFLLHYASYPFQYDDEWRIVEKARQVLIHKVLNTTYMNEADNELLKDVLKYFVADIKERLPSREPSCRKFEEFLRSVDKRRKNSELRELVAQLVTALFRNKNSSRE